ncbi:hypothetical protein KEM52_000920 [Ascosphaera acerosa]|nr:hypothetical protein KEM52_000920 [Ascosphaera acerosa]
MLYLPHTRNTISLLVHFLYTSSLPPVSDESCSAQALCSLLQLCRPYQIDGLLEATVERLHQVLDGRNAAAVFNAAAMAAGCGKGQGFQNLFDAESEQDRELAAIAAKSIALDMAAAPPAADPHAHHGVSSSSEDGSAAVPDRRPSTAFSMFSSSEAGSLPRQRSVAGQDARPPLLRHRSEDESSARDSEETWVCGPSPVVGLQKRGLRGLMEVRHMRRAKGAEPPGHSQASQASQVSQQQLDQRSQHDNHQDPFSPQTQGTVTARTLEPGLNGRSALQAASSRNVSTASVGVRSGQAA